MTRSIHLLMLIAAVTVSQMAVADTVTLTGFKYSNPLDVKISEAGRTIGEYSRGGNVAPGQALDVYAGGFTGLDNGQSFVAYCADIYKYDAWNVSTNYSVGDLATTFGFAKANDLGRLATQFYGGVTNASKSAAFQMAVWEVLFETAGKPYNLSLDTFKATGGTAAAGGGANPSAITLAQSWLDGLASAPMTVSYDMKYLQVAAGNQNLVVFTPSSPFVVSSIPEPETYSLMLAGLSLVCLLRRRQVRRVRCSPNGPV